MDDIIEYLHRGFEACSNALTALDTEVKNLAIQGAVTAERYETIKETISELKDDIEKVTDAVFLSAEGDSLFERMSHLEATIDTLLRTIDTTEPTEDVDVVKEKGKWAAITALITALSSVVLAGLAYLK